MAHKSRAPWVNLFCSFTYAFFMIVGQPIPFEARTKLRIPLASANVPAGFPSPAEDHMENSLDLNEHLVSNPAATFFVRVRGTSMRAPVSRAATFWWWTAQSRRATDRSSLPCWMVISR